MPSARYNVIVPTAYGAMFVNRNDWVEWRGERFGVGWPARDRGTLPAFLLDDLGYRINQSTINLLCMSTERADLAVGGATEISVDLPRANFPHQ